MTIGITKLAENLSSITIRKNRIVFQKNKDGGFSITKYDKKGNQIYYNDHKGFWHRWKRDEDGRVVFAENRDIIITQGGITKYIKKEKIEPYFLLR